MRKLFLSLILATTLAATPAYPQASFTNVNIGPNPVPINGNGTAQVSAQATGSWDDWWWLLVEFQTRAADLDTTW